MTFPALCRRCSKKRDLIVFDSFVILFSLPTLREIKAMSRRSPGRIFGYAMIYMATFGTLFYLQTADRYQPYRLTHAPPAPPPPEPTTLTHIQAIELRYRLQAEQTTTGLAKPEEPTAFPEDHSF